MVHHQFDDGMHAQCLPCQKVHHQMTTTRPQYATTTHNPQYAAASEYVVYAGRGPTSGGRGDMETRPQPPSHHAGSFVAGTTQLFPSSSLVHYYPGYHHRQSGSECAGLGPGEDGQMTSCWAYPATADDDEGEDSLTGWSSLGVYDSYPQHNDSRHHDSDSVYIYQVPSAPTSADGRASATAAVATATCCAEAPPKQQQQPDAISIVKQHLIDMESRAQQYHQFRGQSAPINCTDLPFGWMKKQSFSPLTPTGMHIFVHHKIVK